MAAVSAAAAVAGGTVVLTPAPPGERDVAELVEVARRVSPRTVVVTLGARGALVVPDDGSAALLQAPPDVVAVDHRAGGASRPARRRGGGPIRVAGAPTAIPEEASAMTEPERTHSEEPAEGADSGESDAPGRTPHPEPPAEGDDEGDGDSAGTPG